MPRRSHLAQRRIVITIWVTTLASPASPVIGSAFCADRRKRHGFCIAFVMAMYCRASAFEMPIISMSTRMLSSSLSAGPVPALPRSR